MLHLMFMVKVASVWSTRSMLISLIVTSFCLNQPSLFVSASPLNWFSTSPSSPSSSSSSLPYSSISTASASDPSSPSSSSSDFPSSISSSLKSGNLNRFKRSGISDQRLAELEALYALRRRDHALRAQNPMAIGDFDFDRIGKRKRREESFNYNSLYTHPTNPEDYNQLDSLAY